MTDKTMLIVKVQQRAQEGGTLTSFRLIPLSKETPYVVGEYSLSENALILLHKDQKVDLEAVPKLNNFGEPEQKNGRYIVERRQVSNYFETRLNENESIISFINSVAVNSNDTALYLPYISKIEFKDPNKLEKPSLITI